MNNKQDKKIEEALDSDKTQILNSVDNNKKKCFAICPGCGYDGYEDDYDIEWRDTCWCGRTATQEAKCQKCGCEFTEHYVYSFSVIKE